MLVVVKGGCDCSPGSLVDNQNLISLPCGETPELLRTTHGRVVMYLPGRQYPPRCSLRTATGTTTQAPPTPIRPIKQATDTDTGNSKSKSKSPACCVCYRRPYIYATALVIPPAGGGRGDKTTRMYVSMCVFAEAADSPASQVNNHSPPSPPQT
jgi:hypothetical protein